ncbi:cysteine--tRNA ligase [Candidatus Woesearchaeota archaeon]|nr:MAG: cysteine--tRNA ligase [Candidatus Woesearchaeota archaeon]
MSSSLKLYNTLHRKEEVFRPIEDNKVRMYCCGPTVYDFAHIGNLRTYVFEDVLKRVLLFNKFEVLHVMNLTDVGHLVSDAEEGEDKLVKAIKREGLPLTKESMLKIAGKYTKAFKEDIKRLNIIEPDIWCKATEHIPEMIELIKRIEKNNYTYKTSVGLMFDTSKFKYYAELGRLKLEQLRPGKKTLSDPERRNPSDFALWITNQPKHVMLWDSPWGRGFPGWHIECSAMAIKYLGEQFDIHCGGVDHINVHHTNEIAQAEAATGKHPWVRFWLHGEFLTINKEKMAKSKGAFFILQDLVDKGFDPLVFRYFCFSAHYRSHLNFDFEALTAAKNAFEHLKDRVLDFKENQSSNPTANSYSEDFLNAVNDDLDMPKALSVLWAVVKDSGLGNKEKYDLILEFDKVFGLGLDKLEREKLSPELMELIKERERARKEKDWKKADELRDELKKKGIIVEDSPDGTKWKKVF